MIGLPFLDPGEITPCQEVDPDAFFPDAGGQPARGVKQACASCWAQPDCLEYGIRHDYLEGYWGGAGQPVRRKIRKQRGLPALDPGYQIFVQRSTPKQEEVA